MKKIRIQLCLAVLMTPFITNATTFVVTNTADAGPGSLRQAILNANATPGADVIQFTIAGTGAHSIQPLSPLPIIAGPVLIDGTTQPGFSGKPIIELNGSKAGAGANGLWITAGNSAVAGLAINRFSNAGILLQTNGNNFISGNFIGTDLSGTGPAANLVGILIDGSSANSVGSGDAADRNVISANSTVGLRLLHTSGNVIAGNFIGPDFSGAEPLGNSSDGLLLDLGSTANTVGGTSPGEGNIISANGGNGILMISSSSNVVEGNFVGTDSTGMGALGNALCGVNLSGSPQNTIGGTETGARNLISGNNLNGIELASSDSSGNVIQANFIGTDLTGSSALGNHQAGVFLGEAQNNLIGTADPGARNIISGNADGIHFQGLTATGNSVEGNYIGTDLTGAHPLPNGVGVLVDGAPANAIGTVDAGNLISGNTSDGISLTGADSSGNSVEGNLVGTDRSGTRALANQGNGISIVGAPQNTLGGTDPASQNVISANLSAGIAVNGSAAIGNVIQGNLIGSDVTGAAPLGNQTGISIGGASGLTIGGTDPGAGNVVSGNLSSGLFLGGSGHVAQGNLVGTDASGFQPLPNIMSGVVLVGSDMTIGSEMLSGANVISANQQTGLSLLGARNCTVLGNRIGTDLSGSRILGNRASGILVDLGAQGNALGGVGPGEGNLIAHNLGSGILVQNSTSVSNSIRGNAIFSNAGLGINLRPASEPSNTVTPNDAVDADTGPNNLQNFPVLTNVVYSPGMAVIQGYLRSTPNHGFELDFFSNSATERSSYGEGEVYQPLLDTSLDTDGTGYSEFTFQISGSFSNQYFTATATDLATGDTSEFSAGIGGLHLTSITRVSTNVLVSFVTSSGRNYRLERTDTLSGNPIPWTTVTGAANVAGTGNIVTITDSGAATLPMRCYRVRLLP